MMRHLVPHVRFGTWTSDALTIDPNGNRQRVGLDLAIHRALNLPLTTPENDAAHGRYLAFQWLGVMLEINLGRVRNP